MGVLQRYGGGLHVCWSGAQRLYKVSTVRELDNMQMASRRGAPLLSSPEACNDTGA